MVERKEKFECASCGACCTKFGEKGLPLFEFEVTQLKKISANKKLDIRPTEIFLDKLSGKKFAVLYGLFDQPCIFLNKDKKCKIYKERFLICRQFPIFSTENFKFSKIKDEPEFFDCKCFDCKKQFNNGNPSKVRLKNFYGDCYVSAEKANKKTERIMDLLINMQEQGKVDLCGIDYKTINNLDKIPSLSEFLKEIN